MPPSRRSAALAVPARGLATVGAAALVALPSNGAVAATRSHAEPVPILMYHVVNVPAADAPNPDLYVPKSEFSAQVSWLARHRYHAVTLRQVFDYWYHGDSLPPRPVVLSFDDGYRSDFANALPVLWSHGWPGVLNLQVDFTNTRWGLPPWTVRALIAAGWEVDSHTITHPDLTSLDPARLHEEVAGSRERLRRMFHVPVDFFCYPYGSYDARVVDAVRAAGYVGATTTNYGLARRDEPYTLGRVRVGAGDGVRGLAAKLNALEATR